MSKIAPPHELRRLIGIVGAKLACVPKIEAGCGYEEYREGVARAVVRALAELREQEGARFNDKWDGCSLRLGGISTTCTAGGAGAMRNWINAANRKIAEGVTS